MSGGDRGALRSAIRSGIIFVAVILAPAGYPAEHRAQPRVDRQADADAGQVDAKQSSSRNLTVTISKDDAPGAPSGEHHEESGPKWTDIAVAMSGIGSLIFTAALWFSTRNLWVETKRLAKGAEDQHWTLKDSVREATRAADAAVAGQRPWVRAYFDIQSGLSFKDDVLTLVIETTLVNVGNTPATNVWNWASFYTPKNLNIPPYWELSL